MENITISCCTFGTLEIYYYEIIILDKNNKKVFEGITNYLGRINLKLPSGIYKIIVFANPQIEPCYFKTVIIVFGDKYNTYKFGFSTLKQKNPYVTLSITDQYYDGLPIKKGEIILWQNNT